MKYRLQDRDDKQQEIVKFVIKLEPKPSNTSNTSNTSRRQLKYTSTKFVAVTEILFFFFPQLMLP
jgi:hypothetical protein